MPFYILRRFVNTILVVWAAFSISFVLLYLLPSDPVSLMLSSDIGGGGSAVASSEQYTALASRYGLDKPPLAQYGYLLSKAATGDLGVSMQSGKVVAQIAEALPETLKLAALSLIAAFVIGSAVALPASYWQTGYLRAILLALPPISMAVPTFWIGLVLLQIFAFELRLVPFRDDIRRLRTENGSNPDDCKVLFPILPVLADTQEEAEAIAARLPKVDQNAIYRALAGLSADNNIDFSQFDLDKPLLEIETEGHRGTLAAFSKQGKTLREMVEALLGRSTRTLQFVGTPSSVADRMGEVAEQIGGDGFLIHAFPLTRRYIAEITDGLVPELQKRGLVRTAYEHKHFRDNLLSF